MSTGVRRGPHIEANIYIKKSSGAYTMANESIVVVNKTVGAATTVTLPKGAASGQAAREIWIIDGKGDAATNNITVSRAGSETINGATSLVIASNYGFVHLIWNGTEWNAVSGSSGALAVGGTQVVRATADLAKTSNVTVADITGLSVNLAAGRSYVFHATLFTSSTLNGGAKVGSGGTATATSTIMEGRLYNGATTGTVAQVTALGTIVNATEATTKVELCGEIVVNAGGTFTIQGAQNASHVDTTTFKKGSFLRVWDVA